MHISSHILRLALLRLYAEAGVRAGDWLSFVELGERWTETGLRATDLRSAVDHMVEGGDLVASEREDQLGFALSAGGYRAMMEPGGPLQNTSLADDTTLLNARFRPHRGLDTGLRRRQDDKSQG
ncbi:MAG TPA: hypothetical protein VFA75_06485 [Nevskia sp.]|nr:hypothetical protein [Nevskia sp.]